MKLITIKPNGEVELAQKIDKQPTGIAFAHAGDFQLPNKVVETITKPVEFALKGGNYAMQKSAIFSDEAIRPLKSRIEELSPRMVPTSLMSLR